MRFVFTPPAEEAAGLLSLPWGEPMETATIAAAANGAAAQPLEAEISSE